MLKNKKSDIGIGVVFLIVILILFIGWLYNINQRECMSNRDCSSEAYCGSDFSCHQFPTKQNSDAQDSLLLPSIIIGLAIIVAAVIFKRDKIVSREEKQVIEEKDNSLNDKVPEEVDDISEPYYKSDGNIRFP
ncbi:MAG: hypothetical protein AABX33_04905 [Nanoarchaeota archaeon]